MDLLGRIVSGGLWAGVPGPADDYWYQPVNTGGGASAANKYDKMEARYQKLLEQIQSKITNETGANAKLGVTTIGCNVKSISTPQ